MGGAPGGDQAANQLIGLDGTVGAYVRLMGGISARRGGHGEPCDSRQTAASCRHSARS